MTNRQWLLNQMQNMSDEELAGVIDGTTHICDEVSKDCNKFGNCVYCKSNWLKSEHKEQTKLSDAERVILENADEECKYIARDRSGMLYIYSEKPYKSDCDWWIIKAGVKGKCLDAFNHLFRVVKWEDTEPYNIEDLLRGEANE